LEDALFRLKWKSGVGHFSPRRHLSLQTLTLTPTRAMCLTCRTTRDPAPHHRRQSRSKFTASRDTIAGGTRRDQPPTLIHLPARSPNPRAVWRLQKYP